MLQCHNAPARFAELTLDATKFALDHPSEVAIVPSSSSSVSGEERPHRDELFPLVLWVRGMLVVIVLGLATVFAIAIWINPYDADGSPHRMATHRQMGLPSCTFYEVTGMPCPSCGMTTSFSLLMHGDLLNSLRANWVGTLLAITCLVFIPWALVSVWRGRLLFVRSPDQVLMMFLLALMILMFLRWIIVLGMTRLSGSS